MKLIEATKNNDLELVKKLIDEVYPLNNEDVYCNTTLTIASCRGYIEIVKELIKSGASITAKNNFNDTALMLASWWQRVDVIKELIVAGASLDDKNDIDFTALDCNKHIWQSFDIQDLILNMYPDKCKLLEDKVGIHKDILLKLKMKEILGV